MSAAFTPGPWTFETFEPIGFPPEYPCFHLGQENDEGPGIAGTILEGDLVLADDDENEANARLIAAAPELYEALEALMKRVDHWFDGPEREWSQAVAVLAKARGESVSA